MPPPPLPAAKEIYVGAHRGAMGYAPENTLQAFEIAIAQGTYRIELDVRRTRDGEIVVMHDATVDRTTNGTGAVAELDLAAVRRLCAGGDQPVPTLSEVLRCARGRCKLLVEIKPPGIADVVVEVIRREGMLPDCTISAFDEPTLLRVKELEPELATAYFQIRPQPFSAREVVDRLGVGMLIGWRPAIDRELLADAHAAGLHVRCGFGDQMSYEETEALFRELVDLGTDEISCGRPDWIVRMIRDLGATPVTGSGAARQAHEA
ncbi:MAG: glpQ [Armatimonadetes bacterium]|jgi:glycerophosphoryl diester phosphodiesterase|nr:glpQ [Armatimonadota bacterium]